ncbi:MAG: hypothetical protein QOH39_1777 [Verrucomicrobiota bacterium]|jgi:hypothetical protein
MARKDAVEVEGAVVELLPNTMFRVELPMAIASWPIFGQNEAALHSYLARRQSYARDFPLRFVEGANHISPKVTARTGAALFLPREL